MRFNWKFFRRISKAAWVDDLSRHQRRVLAQNLRQLVESKTELDRRLKKSAHPR